MLALTIINDQYTLQIDNISLNICFVRQQIDRVVGGVSIAEVRDWSSQFALAEGINAGWQYFRNVVEEEKEKEAAAFMDSGSDVEASEEQEERVPELPDEFFKEEDLPRTRNAQNRKDMYNFSLMALDGGVSERRAALMATGETK